MIFKRREYLNRKGVLKELGYTGKRLLFDSEWYDLLFKLYVVSGLSTTCMSITLGFSPETIRNDMKKLRIPTEGWKKFAKAGAHGFPDECVSHRVCIYCGTAFSTIYSKEVACKNPACKKKFYDRNKTKRKMRNRYNEDFV